MEELGLTGNEGMFPPLSIPSQMAVGKKRKTQVRETWQKFPFFWFSSPPTRRPNSCLVAKHAIPCNPTKSYCGAVLGAQGSQGCCGHRLWSLCALRLQRSLANPLSLAPVTMSIAGLLTSSDSIYTDKPYNSSARGFVCKGPQGICRVWDRNFSPGSKPDLMSHSSHGYGGSLAKALDGSNESHCSPCPRNECANDLLLEPPSHLPRLLLTSFSEVHFSTILLPHCMVLPFPNLTLVI